ncbi:alpha/beta fold hydrolase [Microcoleus sp. Pol11C2]|uniref:alpha/beta fold hydrolase n=1 Tax=Microcoleus sp. Pol11C2 TaxID=3055389 RepID=UPI002FD0E9EF
MIFKPTFDTLELPSNFNLKYEEVSFLENSRSNSPDKLHGWFIPSLKPDTEVGTILYFHGSGTNISNPIYIRDVAQLNKLGFSVFIFDYRGYGQSGGDFPSELSIYEDAANSLKYLTEKRKIAYQKIYLFGVSLGGAVAINLAVKEPSIAGLIVVSSFTSMQEEVLHLGYRMFPISWILNQRFDSLSKVASLKIPILIVHGTSDRSNPASMSQKLYDAAPHPKQLLLIPGFGHDNISDMIESPHFRDGLKKYIQDVNATK